MRYRRLDPAAILETVLLLEKRVGERFPDAGLLNVVRELAGVGQEAVVRTRRIRRPIVALRVVVAALLVTIGALLCTIPLKLKRWGEFDSATEFIQVLEPTLGAIFFVSAFVVFLVSIEARIKRARCLSAIHELRSLAHVVDMHQLTKDPALVLLPGITTSSSPARSMDMYELGRYLDYCTEMLSLISKIAVLYVQDFPDYEAVGAVDEIENLTTGLSRKIWQKIMLVHRHA